MKRSLWVAALLSLTFSNRRHDKFAHKLGEENPGGTFTAHLSSAIRSMQKTSELGKVHQAAKM